MISVTDDFDVKREALSRMKMLGLSLSTREEFEKGNILKSCADKLYYLNAYENEIVEEFEHAYNAYVYHIIQTGDVYSILYISGDGYWDKERDSTAMRHPGACVYDVGKQIFVDIGVRNNYGVLRKIY